MKLRFVQPANLAEHVTLGSAIGLVSAGALWLVAAGLSQIDAAWTRALVAWLVEDVSFRGFARDVMTGAPLAGALFAILYMRRGTD